MGCSNYDIMCDHARQQFLRYDQKKMIQKFALQYDTRYLYLRFVGRQYRICRKQALVEWSADGFVTAVSADFNVCMTLFDLLCYSKEDCCASGQYALVTSLKGTGHGGDPGNGIFASYYSKFDGKEEQLACACASLGGEKYVVGDVSYIIPIFADLSMLFQFWASDEEFPAQIKMKWDEHVLSYMHFETVYYAMGHILQRLDDMISRKNL